MAATRKTPSASAPNLSVTEAADYLNVTVRCIQKMIADGRLPAYKLGPRVVRLRRADIESALQPYGSA
jgi:excisionase family DNA binding protein